MSKLPDPKYLHKLIERSLGDLKPLPQVATRVLEETAKPNTTAHQLEEIIQCDPAVTTKVLRVVNSAYYGFQGQVTSLSQACVILGIQQIRTLVLSIAAFGTMPPQTDRQAEALKAFWMHSFGTAAAAQAICRLKRLGIREIEEVFIGGLLHDVGRLFLFSNFTEVYDQVMAYAVENQVSIADAEEKLLGITHGRLGAKMMRLWTMPESLTQLIELHEGPFNEASPWMLFPIHVGDELNKFLYLEAEKGDELQISPFVEAWLDFDEEKYTELREVTFEKIDAAQRMFGLMAA